MHIHICCRNWQSDRVLPRFARHLIDAWGWTAGKKAMPEADYNYYLGYFEHLLNKGFNETPVAAYMTHLEENQKEKADLYNKVAKLADLRISMNAMQLPHLKEYGPSLQIPLPLELEHFTLASRQKHATPVVGLSGYTYNTGRKGAEMVSKLAASELGRHIALRASGRGWPCKTTMYRWQDLPRFFQSLDVFLCTSLVEGGPMTTLEAMATGCPVVIPRNVGLHDELPDAHGIYHYERGDYAGMHDALARCLNELGTHDREALRMATAPHSIQAWQDGNRRMFEHALYDKPAIGKLPDWQGRAGVYMVAFGKPSMGCAIKAITSIRTAMPDLPVALVSDRPLGLETIFIEQPDLDIGGRIAKLKIYDLAPKEWQYVLYLDADTEMKNPVPQLFDWLVMGWEFIICKDVRGGALMKDFRRPNNEAEFHMTVDLLGTAEALQLNGGVWSFRRCERTEAFFKRWYAEWDKYGARDQGALIRALYADPLRMLVLGNEWNYFPDYCKHEKPAGIWHYPQTARRWEGQIPGRLDGQRAWARVKR